MTAFRRFGFAVALLMLAGCNQEAETAPTAKCSSRVAAAKTYWEEVRAGIRPKPGTTTTN